MPTKKVTRIAKDTRPYIAESYQVKGYSAKACEFDAKTVELGFKPDFLLNVSVGAGECLLEAVTQFGEKDVYLTLTNNREAEDVSRMRDKPQSLAAYAAVRLGPTIREYIDAKRL